MEDDKSVTDNMEDDKSVTVTTWKMTRVRLWKHGRWQECDCDNMEDDKSVTDKMKDDKSVSVTT
jgi:hypothetical protein